MKTAVLKRPRAIARQGQPRLRARPFSGEGAAGRESIGSADTSEPIQRLADDVVRRAARLCHADLAVMMRLTPERDRLEVVAVFGTDGVIAGKAVPVAESLNGMVVTSGRSFRSADLWHDGRRIVRAIARRNRTRGLLIVPLPGWQGPAGTLAVASRQPWHFSARDQAVLEAFAHVAGLALEVFRIPLWEVAAVADASSAAAPPVPGNGLDSGPPREPESKSPPLSYKRLTPRQRDILALLRADRTCVEVASALGLSPHTVRHHLERLKLRFGQATLHGLVAWAATSTDVVPPRT